MNDVMPDMVVQEEYLVNEHGLVAEEHGAILGYAIVRVDGPTAHLRDLFVDVGRFRMGIGKALFAEAASYARRRGATQLTLVGDPNAVPFYERLGMRRIGEEASIVGAARMLPVMAIDLEGAS